MERAKNGRKGKEKRKGDDGEESWVFTLDFQRQGFYIGFSKAEIHNPKQKGGLQRKKNGEGVGEER